MPNTLDVRTVVETIKRKFEDVVFEHDMDMLADVYNLLVKEGTTLIPLRDYFIVEED